MKDYTISLLGNGPYYNRGCEAIVRGTIAGLQEAAADASFTFDSIYLTNNLDDQQTETDTSINHHPVKQIVRFSPQWAKYRISRALPRLVRFNVFSGFDDALQQSTSGVTLLLGGDNATMHKGNRPLFAFEMMRLAKQTGKPAIFWGASIGPFTEDPEFEAWATEQLKSLDLICVRESVSYDYLQSLGLENVLLVADPSFLMAPAPCPLPADIESVLTEGCIGLNFSPLVGSLYPSMAEWTQRVHESIKLVVDQCQKPVLLIPHVIDESTLKRNDKAFMQDVLDLLPEAYKDRVYLLTETLNAAQTKWVIGRTQVFAGCRTHSTFAAISTRVPTLCVSYSAKARGVAFDAFDSYDWLIDGKTLEPAAFAKKVAQMDAQQDALRAHLQTRVPIFEQRAREASQRVLALYQGR